MHFTSRLNPVIPAILFITKRLYTIIFAAIAAILLTVVACDKEDPEFSIPVTGVSVSPESLELMVDEFSELKVTLTPANPTDRRYSFSSSDESVATVTPNGNVGGVSAGEAVITVTTMDGNHQARCTVKVSDYPQPEAVDMGLSVKWGSFNIGASKPEEYGKLYQWGAVNEVTKGNYLDWPYKAEPNGYYRRYSKYIPSSMPKYWMSPSSTVPDNKTVLDPKDDVAHVKLGDKWRMPTVEECEELVDNCTPSAATMNGVAGVELTSRMNGNTIFLPLAGMFYEGSDTGRVYIDSNGYYWSSTLEVFSTPNSAYTFNVYQSGKAGVSSGERSHGCSVRPVCE